MPFVVDNSVVMSWFFEDETDGYCDDVLDALATDVAVVPELWPIEVSNVLVVAEHRKQTDAVRSTRFIDLLSALPINVVPTPAGRYGHEILSLARSTALSAYDASYLDLALREQVALATTDRALKDAATRVGVPLYRP